MCGHQNLRRSVLVPSMAPHVAKFVRDGLEILRLCQRLAQDETRERSLSHSGFNTEPLSAEVACRVQVCVTSAAAGMAPPQSNATLSPGITFSPCADLGS